MATLAINGGTPVRSAPYPSWPEANDDEYVAAVETVVRSGEWGGFPEPGVHAAAFESAFAAYQGAAHGVLMMNGTITMEVACKALGIGWGDEVIVPALTFAATAYAPMAAGALPVFVDITPDTWTIDPELVEAAITEQTRAIIPVHLGHHMADMDRIMDYRAAARAGGDRGLRARARPTVARPGRRLHRRLRLVQPSVLEDPDLGRGRVAAHERRAARAARPLDRRLRPREGPRREGVHVRRELPPVGAQRRAARGRDASGSPRSRRRAPIAGKRFEELVARHPRRSR